MSRLKLLLIWIGCMIGGLIAALWMFVGIIFGAERSWRIAIGFDQVANAAFGGEEDETISSRCWRHRSHQPYKSLVHCINWLFQDSNHCRNAFWMEQARRAKVRLDE